MKVAIAGKGGAGKTTIAGTLARVIAEQGQQVVAIDDDSNPNLAVTVGVDRSAAAGLGGIPRDMLEERTDADGTRRLVLTVPAEDFIDRFGVPVRDRLTLLVMGGPNHGGSG
jgi:CO dehydrogenase maturation factor